MKSVLVFFIIMLSFAVKVDAEIYNHSLFLSYIVQVDSNLNHSKDSIINIESIQPKPLHHSYEKQIDIGNIIQDSIVRESFPMRLQGRTIERAIVYTMDDKDFEVKNLTFSEDSILYEDEGTRNIVSKNINDISKVEEYTGNEALSLGLPLGLCISGIFALIDALSEAERIKSEDKIDADDIVGVGSVLEDIGFYALGFLAGIAIGSFITNWETVYESKDYGIPPETDTLSVKSKQPEGFLLKREKTTSLMQK
jgi:hypothetical protein